MYVIYEIKNIKNNKKYIGSSSNYVVRWKRHLNELIKNKHHCIYLQRSFNTYGLESFIFNIVEECSSKEEMLKLETHYINSDEMLYNTSKVASGGI